MWKEKENKRQKHQEIGLLEVCVCMYGQTQSNNSVQLTGEFQKGNN